MGLSHLALVFVFLPSNYGGPLCASDMGICLRPLVDTWEHIRNIESHAADLIFPLPLYRKNSTLVLCERYDGIRRKCFPEDCGPSPMISFVKQQLGYFCGALLPLYIKKHECTSSTLLRNRQCLRHLHGMPNPLVSAGEFILFSTKVAVRCNSFVDFFNCMESFLDKKCGNEAVVLFGGAIKTFGCHLDSGAQLDEDLKLLKSIPSYTLDALPDFFQNNRPDNYSELVTSAEMVSTTDSIDSTELQDMTELTTAEMEKEELVLTSTIGAEESTVNEQIASTVDNLVLKQEEDDNNLISPDQELTDSVEGATTLNDTIRMDGGNEKAEEEGVKDAEITSTEAVDHGTLPTTTEKEMIHEAFSETTEIPNSSTVIEIKTEAATAQETPQESTAMPCSQEDEDYVAACHSLLLRRLSALSPKDTLSQRRFPLADVPLHEVQHLCKRYDEGNKCAADQLMRCESMQILKLINTQLEAVCFRIDSMPREYQCILDTFRENPKCQESIKGVLPEDQDICMGQQESFDCFTEAFTCSYNSLILLREMVRGHGCRVDLKRHLIKAPTTTARTTTTTASFHETMERSSNATDPVMILEKASEGNTSRSDNQDGDSSLELTTVPIPLLTTVEPMPEVQPTETTTTTTPAPWFGTCSPTNRKIARMCMGPLIRTWDGLRRKRSQLKKSHFPIYRYTKEELLDLCDGYANSFLCAGHDTIRYCVNDELVSFAQGHLGYQCSPQNLQRFLAHYDCIIKVEGTTECKTVANGEVLPGNKAGQTCESVAAYADCMAPLVMQHCKNEGATEFMRTIQQFGCKNVKPFLSS